MREAIGWARLSRSGCPGRVLQRECNIVDHYTDEEKDWTVDPVDEPSSLTVGTEWRKVPSMAVVETVAAATDRSQLELPSLQESIEADALDEILTGPSVSVIYVSFRYAGTTVTMGSDRSIVVDVR